MTTARVIPFPVRPAPEPEVSLRDFEQALVDLVEDDVPTADHHEVATLVDRAIAWIDDEDVPVDEALLLVEGLVRHVLDGTLLTSEHRLDDDMEPPLRLVHSV